MNIQHVWPVLIIRKLEQLAILWKQMNFCANVNIDGLVQDCSNSNALAMELLQSRTEPSIRKIL